MHMWMLVAVCECLSDFKKRRAKTSCQVYISFCTLMESGLALLAPKQTHTLTHFSLLSQMEESALFVLLADY